MNLNIVCFFLFLILFSCKNSNIEDSISRSQIEILSEKVNKNPSKILPLINRAKYNLEKEKFESALFDLKQCLQIDSLHSESNYLASLCYFEISKYDRTKQEYGKYALSCVKNSLIRDKNNYKSLALYGEINIAYAKYNDAIDLFNRSLKQNYNQHKIHHLMGYAFKKNNQLENALNCYQNSININPDYIEPYIEIALIYQQKNDTLTKTFYENALKLDSTNIIVLYNLALYYQNNLKYNNALETYNKLLNYDSFNANTHYNIGFIHMELDLHEVAVNNFADAIYSNSVFYEAYYARGICFETLGNIAQAEVDYERSIEINPEYKYAVDALNNLKNNNKKYN